MTSGTTLGIPQARLLWRILTLPKVTIRMAGDDNCKGIYYKFTERHPRFKLIQRKRWGVALLRLPDRLEQYLEEQPRELNRKRNRCLNLGYRFAVVDPLARLDEILAINQSVPERQGKPMDPSYLGIDALRDYFSQRQTICGVLDAHGVLKAYADVVIAGEVAILNRLMGHADALDRGVMYFCISEVVREMAERRQKQGQPQWLCYDTFFGGSAGLRYFKERLGFRPHRVRWVWAP